MALTSASAWYHSGRAPKSFASHQTRCNSWCCSDSTRTACIWCIELRGLRAQGSGRTRLPNWESEAARPPYQLECSRGLPWCWLSAVTAWKQKKKHEHYTFFQETVWLLVVGTVTLRDVHWSNFNLLVSHDGPPRVLLRWVEAVPHLRRHAGSPRGVLYGAPLLELLKP